MPDVPATTYTVPPAPTAAEVRQARTPASDLDPQDSVAVATLQQRLDRVIRQNAQHEVSSSVSLTALHSGQSLYRNNATATHFAASLNKLPVALLLLEDLRTGRLTLDTAVTWTADDVRGGFGVYDQKDAPTQATVGELLHDMLNTSGNTAVRALILYPLGGPQAVNDRLAAYAELPNTRLQILEANSFYLGDSTSDEMLWTMHKLMETEDDYQARIRASLETNIFSYFGVRSQLEGNDFIVLANKVGILDDAEGNNRHDVGIIYNTSTGRSYGYAFMTTTPSNNVSGTAQAEHSLDLLGRHVLRYAGDTPGDGGSGSGGRQSGSDRAVTPERRVQY